MRTTPLIYSLGEDLPGESAGTYPSTYPSYRFIAEPLEEEP